jgi:3-phosphoshikimate 1-carboxyvinyltransferase
MSASPEPATGPVAKQYRLTPPADATPFCVSNRPGPGECAIHIPGSKSLTNRALLLAALAEGTSTLDNVLFSDDTRVMLDALSRLGFNVQVDEAASRVSVEGGGGRMPNEQATLFLGNAGTAMRFLTAACCLGKGPYVLEGIERMHERPIGQLVEALGQLGARIEYRQHEGYPPLRVHGGSLTGGRIDFPRAVSSQYVSALLHVAPYLPDGLHFHSEAQLTSWPYVEMTLKLMQQFGAHLEKCQWRAPATIIVAGGKQYRSQATTIEPDASNASYFLAAAALLPNAHCAIHGLGGESSQGDRHFASTVLRPMGAAVAAEGDRLAVTGPAALRGIDVDLGDMPDLAQTLAVLAVFAEGATTIRGIGNLRVKETDRIAAMQHELGKLGATVTVHDGSDQRHAKDDITISPPADGVLQHAGGEPITPESPVVIETYDDHRMAMSFALLGLRQAGVVIDDPGCVNKTFPAFFAELAKLGVGVEAVEPAEPTG